MAVVVYTAAPAWKGPPFIAPSRKGRVEHGPGLYFTTHLSTARRYAGGPRTILRVELEPPLVWLEDTVVPTELLVRWVAGRRGLRKKKEIIDDLISRGESGLPRGSARAAALVNLMVNHDAITGEHGPALAEFLTWLGIDASHVPMSGTEEWIVLFNPAKVVRWERVGPAAEWELPPVRVPSAQQRQRY